MTTSIVCDNCGTLNTVGELPPKIHFPDESDGKETARLFFAGLKDIDRRKGEAADRARGALARIVKACGGKTDQGNHLRHLLFSLWNGQPTTVSAVLCLDYALREDFCAVLLGFGYEPMRGGTVAPFFYDAMEAAFADAGLLDWFTSTGGGK